MITVQTLRDLGACSEAVALAEKKLPKNGLTQAQFIRAYLLFRMGDLRGESPAEWDCAALLYRACLNVT